MEYMGFVFGIFGLMAYLQISALKKRVDDLEREMTKIEGTEHAQKQTSLRSVVRKWIGEEVILELKEDHMDADIINYGNTKHGSNVVLDTDNEWMLVQITTPKTVKMKLLRLESVERISRKAGEQ
ncbi:MAG: hypothetical protein IKG46_12140 [Solobacterium sp.]|nr:hypothetical protein [Solobacterium sp.]